MKTEIAKKTEPMDVQRVPEAGTGDIDIQIATAKRYPRDVARFQRNAMTMATLDEETAGECLYTLPRDGKNIVGAGIRFAEIVASAWGNIHSATRLVKIEEDHVVCEAAVWDLETNVKHCEQAIRRIVNKYGKRYSQDMILMTAQAGQSIALRNAHFRVIPRGMWKKIEAEVRKVIAGDEMTLEKRRKAAMKHFVDAGVPEAHVLHRLGRHGIESITVDDLVVLRGIVTAVKDGVTTLEEAFPAPLPAGVKRERELQPVNGTTEPTEDQLEKAFKSVISVEREPGEDEPEE